MTAFLMIFRRFPTTFRRFSRIVRKARRTFPNIFREFPKISEDIRRLPKAFEEDSKMFRWYTNQFKYSLRDNLNTERSYNDAEEFILSITNPNGRPMLPFDWLIYSGQILARCSRCHKICFSVFCGWEINLKTKIRKKKDANWLWR